MISSYRILFVFLVLPLSSDGVDIEKARKRILSAMVGSTKMTKDFGERCMQELGCFSNGPPFFDPVKRPASHLPMDRDIIATKFFLINRRTGDEKILIREGGNREDLEGSAFDPSVPTKIIIHGFMDDIQISPWGKEIADAFLKIEELNVIVIDWSRGNNAPYVRAIANSRVVAAEIADFIKHILEMYPEYAPEDIHIIGHSLGAQIAGYIGNRIPNLGRITGLDPANFFFIDVDLVVRLDKNDAKFVDIIHTDASYTINNGLGYPTNVGDLDFYPNGGNNQTGCQFKLEELVDTYGITKGSMIYYLCDHERAFRLFLATLKNPPYSFIGIACESWDSFIRGECTECDDSEDKCKVMDFSTRIPQARVSTNATYFSLTTEKPPYYLEHYKITLSLRNDSTEAISLKKFKIFVNQNGREYDLLLPYKPVSFSPGSNITLLAGSPVVINQKDTVYFQWFAPDHYYRTLQGWTIQNNSTSNLDLETIQLKHVGMSSRRGRQFDSSLCFKFDTWIPPAQSFGTSNRC